MKSKRRNFKTRKLFLLVMVTIILTVIQFPLPVSARTSGDFSYDALADGTIEITSYTGETPVLEIPATIDGYTVTSIGGDAFFDCYFIEEVVIPNTVINIAPGAFRNTSMVIDGQKYDNGILYMGDCLIDVDNDLAGNVKVKDGTRVIAGGAFKSCASIKTIDIPNTVVGIGRVAFSECAALTEITIPDSVVYFDSFVMFEGCTALSSAYLGNGIKEIDDDAFSRCENLRTIVLGNSITRIGDRAFEFTGIETINIPDSVKTIETRAFLACDFLKSIHLGKGIEKIEEDAFSCENLESVIYAGTETDWQSVDVNYSNSEFIDMVTFSKPNDSTPEVIPNDNDTDKTNNNTPYVMVGVLLIVVAGLIVVALLWKKRKQI